MRKNLLESFDKIYVLNLHGNSKKKELSQDGTPDQNVFDIMQGVSINIFVKKSVRAKGLARIFSTDLFGKREFKYSYLNQHHLNSIKWQEIQIDEPYYFFKSIGGADLKKNNNGFKLSELFVRYNSGIQTKNDSLTIKHTSNEIENIVDSFREKDIDALSKELGIKDSASWKIDNAKADLTSNKGKVIDIQYRLFDTRKTYFTGKSSGFIGRTRGEVMLSMLQENLGLVFKRTGKIYGETYDFIFVSKSVVSEGLFAIDPMGREYLAPLYNYAEGSIQQLIYDKSKRTPNLNPEIVKQIASKLGLTFTNEKETTTGTFAPIDILDYIYAVLHSPTYREKYKEFLKIDFPRVPYPTNANRFWQLVKLGGELRQIHLLESDTVNRLITQYPIGGDNVVRKIRFEENYELVNGNTVTLADPAYPFGRVYINDTQYFQQVPKAAWEFYIGGYQPAQKWLKDRKDRELSFEDILHYQKIIVALTQTARIMAEVDKVGVE
jgi:predicted helicase